MIYVIWGLLGFISVWRTYHGFLKGWYLDFNESYLDYKESGLSGIKMLLLGSPLLILGGLISLVMTEIIIRDTDDKNYHPTWWFTTKNK